MRHYGLLHGMSSGFTNALAGTNIRIKLNALLALGWIQLLASHLSVILDSIVVSIPACHAGDRGSIPRRGDNIFHLVYAEQFSSLIVDKVDMETKFSSCIAFDVIAFICELQLFLLLKRCIGRESNPGRPRGRRAFYHWTTDASSLHSEKGSSGLKPARLTGIVTPLHNCAYSM